MISSCTVAMILASLGKALWISHKVSVLLSARLTASQDFDG
jgi:hypothetical protein